MLTPALPCPALQHARAALDKLAEAIAALTAAANTQLPPAMAHARQAVAVYGASVQHIPPVAQLRAAVQAEIGALEPDYPRIKQLIDQCQEQKDHSATTEAATAMLRDAAAVQQLLAQVNSAHGRSVPQCHTAPAAPSATAVGGCRSVPPHAGPAAPFATAAAAIVATAPPENGVIE